jgi:hypothetical protein
MQRKQISTEAQLTSILGIYHFNTCIQNCENLTEFISQNSSSPSKHPPAPAVFQRFCTLPSDHQAAMKYVEALFSAATSPFRTFQICRGPTGVV